MTATMTAFSPTNEFISNINSFDIQEYIYTVRNYTTIHGAVTEFVLKDWIV